MHIEPGLVEAGKIGLSYLTTAGVGAYGLKLIGQDLHERGAVSLLARIAATTALVFSFFEVLPHHPVGVSEVHLILGSMLFLLFGAAPAAAGLALGLLLQGMFFAPMDLPQYGMNVTTLLVPLFVVTVLAKRIIASKTPYVELSYRQVLMLSTTYQAGIVTWVAFWAFYGQGLTLESVAKVMTFGGAYMTVIVVEPLVDLGVLALAKLANGGLLFERRLHQAG